MKRVTFLSSLITITIICVIILAIGDDECSACYMPEVMAGKFLVCGLVIIIGSIYFTKKYRTIEDIIFEIENQPLLETNEATEDVSFAGEGVVRAPKTINSYFSKTPCVYYHAILEKLVKSGKSSSWRVVKNIAEYVPFYLEDSRGKLKVDVMNVDDDFSGKKIAFMEHQVPHPRNSEIDCDAVLKKVRYNEKISKGLFPITKKYRKSEYVLKPGENVFVYGCVSRQGEELVLMEHQRHPLIISQKPRELYIKEFYKGKNIIYLAYLLIALGYMIALYALNFYIRLDSLLFVTILIVGIVAIVASMVITMYNRIIQLKHRAYNALSNIDGELRRRFDLIPQLAEVTRRYAVYEAETQKLITELRSKMVMGDHLGTAEESASKKFIALMERYPDLKASRSFKNLMINLVDTEERIAFSRTFYNRTVRKYNVLIQQFPFIILSTLFGQKNMEFVGIEKI